MICDPDSRCNRRSPDYSFSGEHIGRIGSMTMPSPMLLLLLLLSLIQVSLGTNLSYLASALVNGTLLAVLLDPQVTKELSPKCGDGLSELRNGIQNSQDWAIRVVDATGKVPAGVLEGSVTFLGSFQECLGVRAPNKSFVGQYCTVTLAPTPTNESSRTLITAPFRWDLCLPSSCSSPELQLALASVNKSYAISASVSNCLTDRPTVLDTAQIVALVLLCLLASVVISGTILDVVRQIYSHLCNSDTASAGQCSGVNETKAVGSPVVSKWVTGLESFSLYSNSIRTLDTSSSGQLSALNGLRVLSTMWIIVGHSYFYIDWPLVGNSKQAVEVRYNFFFQPILNFSITVDTFFLLSGLLVVYSNLKKLNKMPYINWFQFFFHRYWRLTPPVAFLILFLLLWPTMGSGPYWTTAVSQAANCRTGWWANLFYLNNFIGIDRPCLEHGWYLAADMQFYVLSPLVFYPMWRWPRLGLAVNALFLVTSVVTPAVLGVSYNLLPTSLYFEDGMRLFETFRRAYVTPYCRMGPYCVGMALGYILATKRKVRLPLVWQATLWSACLACNASVMYGTYSWNAGSRHSPALNAFYLAVHRTAWATGIAWVIYACVHGYAGIVNHILSWPGFVPLSRLTYVTYLIHVFILKTFSGLLGDRLVFSHFVWVVIIIGVISMSFGLALAVSLCCEVPFQRLERLLWPPRRSSSPILRTQPSPKDDAVGDIQGVVNKAFQDAK